jgi:cytochrome P450
VTSARSDRAALPGAIDLCAPESFGDVGTLHANFARLRSEAPAAWHPHPEGGFWVLSRHADVLRVASESADFGAGAGHLIGGLGNATPTARAEAVAFRDGAAPFAADASRAHARLAADGVQALAPGIRARVVERLASHAGSGALDFVELVAPLPSEVRATLAGVPGAHQDRLIGWIDSLGGRHADGAMQADGPRRTIAAELFAYADELLERKRRQPGEDLISDWLAAEPRSGPITGRHVGLFLYAFVAIGSATTRHVAAAGQRLLFQHPGVAAQLRADPTIIPAAVEEMLRLAPPFHYSCRTALRDTEIAGQRVAKDDTLTLWLTSANRDSAAFENPTRFAPERPRNDHLSFIGGGLFALGATLARTELAILFEELAQRFPEMLPAGPVERARSNHDNRTVRLPVHLGRAA